LVGWGDDGSIIAPELIETAERTGLIHAIDRVVYKAIRFARLRKEVVSCSR
jgi:EAL domain-containing protein (putative c-di-GMP-specific phosphodiesterase class I)